MTADVRKLDTGEVEITVSVPIDEMKPYLDRAAERLTKHSPVAGFRPGKAPAHVLKSRFGEMALYEEAVQDIVTQTLWRAVKDNAIHSVGKPSIAVQSLTPGLPVVYKATVAVVPTVTLKGWRDIKVQKSAVAVTDTEVEKVIEDLRGMQAQEVVVTREARLGDKVEINFQVRKNGAVIDGGTGSKYPVILGKGSMIPGFEDQIVGMKANEKKEFKLKFPKPYVQETLAGAEADFTVEVLAVYERTLPDKNDAWAQQVISKPYTELVQLLRENLQQEKEMKEQQRIEEELLESIIKAAIFSVIPKLLTESEISKMLMELEDDIAARGMKWDDYLKSMKRTREQLVADFTPHAEKRVKGALILRELGRELNVVVSAEEVNTEIARQREQYADNQAALANLASKEYRQFLGLTLANRKVMETLLAELAGTKKA